MLDTMARQGEYSDYARVAALDPAARVVGDLPADQPGDQRGPQVQVPRIGAAVERERVPGAVEGT